MTAPYYKSDIKSSKFIDRQLIDGMEVLIINAPDSNLYSKLKRIWNAIRFAILCSWFVCRGRYDVVVASSGPITVGIPGLASKMFSKSKLIFEVRDLWPEGGVQMGLFKGKLRNRMAYWFESICYKQSDAIVALSPGMRDYITNKVPGKMIDVIPNSSDTDLFQNSSAVPFAFPKHLIDKKLFLYFGSLGLMDACDEILNGFFNIKHRNDLGLVFIGDGAYRKDLESMAHELGLTAQVHFTGLLPKSELPAWLKLAQASFVMFKPFPVLGTSSPNKLFDSFAAGLPIIQNTKGWISDLVCSTGCGINIDSGDSESMSTAILKFADDSEFQKNAALASFRLGQTDFNRGHLFEKYMDVINKVVRV